MATTGYIANLSADGDFGHTNFISTVWGPEDKWVSLIKQAGSDVHVMERDGTTPASPGDSGGWANITMSAGTNEIDTRSSAFCGSLAYDHANDVLHATIGHSSTEHHHELSYSSGSANWTLDVSNQSANITDADKFSTGVDTNGVIWDFEISGTNIVCNYKAIAGSWTAGPTIDTVGGTAGNIRISPATRCIIGGAAALAIAYNDDDTTNRVLFAYRLDSDALSAAWTVNEVDATTYDSDGHIFLVSGVLSGDTDSTFVIAAKQGSGGYAVYSGSSPSSWSAQNTDIGSSTTRIKLALDATHGEVYAFFRAGDALSVNYMKSDAKTLSFGASTVILEDDRIAGFSTDIGVPEPIGYTSTHGSILVLGESAGVTWWNEISIPAPATGATEYGNRKTRGVMRGVGRGIAA